MVLHKQATLFLLFLVAVVNSTAFAQSNCVPPPGGAGAAMGASSGGGSSCPPPPPGGGQESCFGCGASGNSGGAGTSFSIPIIRPMDPNDIQGPTGVTIKKWMAAKDVYGYKVRYENDPKFANGPAQKVIIQIPIHPDFNIHSLRLGDFGFGKFIFNVPPNSPSYYTRLDLKDSLGLMVDVLAGINVVTREAIWIFQSIDPNTGDQPLDAMAGFLPVNDTTTREGENNNGNGEGFVTFSLTPDETTVTGDIVSAQAGIIFDINAPVMTNIEENTIDAVAPTSKITLATVTGNKVDLHLTGADDTGGSGLRDFTIYVSENGGPYTFLKTTAQRNTEFEGIPGNTYCFFSIARDSVDNHEGLNKNQCEVSVQLFGGGPLPVTWLYFRGKDAGADAELNWATATEINTDHFILERSMNGRDFSDIARVSAKGNSASVSEYRYLDLQAMKINTRYLYYRLRQVDMDGKKTYSNIIQIAVSANKDHFIKVYPNPFSQNLTLLINTTERPHAGDKVQLYSINGVLLYEHNLSGRQNNSPLQLTDLPQLTPGVYMLKTFLNGVTESVTIIKR
jgi:hypothetical protein